MKYSEGFANGVPYMRYEFETHADLEAFFLRECWGVIGLRSKVIGTVLLVTIKKEGE